jgi:histidyl-tRNA synthetase
MSETSERPTGALDHLPEQAELLERARRRALSCLRAHGYRQVQVPMYEGFALYERLYGQEIRQTLMTFDTDREYALRPDLTAGVVRALTAGLREAPWTPLRAAAAGSAFRHERARPLRLREFQQVSVERLGDRPEDAPGADLELLSLARLVLLELGIEGGMLRVGDAPLREAVLEALGPDLTRRRRASAALDALTRLRERLEPPRTGADLPFDPEAGAAARLDPWTHPELEVLLDELARKLRGQGEPWAAEGDAAARAGALLRHLERRLEALGREAGLRDAQIEALGRLSWPAASLEELGDAGEALVPGLHARLLAALGHIEGCRAELEPCVLRFGLGATRWGGFYTGFFFEIDAPVLGPDVSQVIGGGRYDGVAARIGGLPLSACGFGLGLERALAAAVLLRGPEATRKRLLPQEPVLIAWSDAPGADARAADLAEELGQRGCPIAYHPRVIRDRHPHGGLPDEDLRALAALPGAPYRHALLVDDGVWVANLTNGSCFEADLQTILLMFARS